MADVIRYLAVPVSVELEAKTGLLGRVPDPFWKLRAELDLFGYPDTDEIKAALKKVLEIE